MVVEFDTRRVLDPDQGSLFGVIAETVPLAHFNQFVGSQPPRIDWIGRPEQTNMLLDNKGMGDVDDLRDLWNQQPPFAIPQELRPLFLQRLKASLTEWDMRDGQQDWTPSALAAHANVRLDDYLLFDVAKPITEVSYSEIERSTLNGRTYQTGGGRTVDANVIDDMLTLIVNRDREQLRGGATQATKPSTKNFPYFAAPNTELQSVVERVDLQTEPDKVWALIGQFGGYWHPLIADIKLIGTGVGASSRRSMANRSSNVLMPSMIPADHIAIQISVDFQSRITAGSLQSSPMGPAVPSSGAHNTSLTTRETWS
jgi:hypothetical protein